MTGPVALTEGVFLLRPLWLLALLPLGMLAALRLRPLHGGEWQRIVDPPLWQRMQRMGLVARAGGGVSGLAPAIAGTILALALSGPAVLRSDEPEYRPLDPMLILLDLSPSVTQGPGLADLQAAAAFLLAHAGGRPVGLVVYAADGYLASAPTADPASLQSLIAVLDEATMPITGSRPDIALSGLRDILGERLGQADIILISDGGGVDAAADEAARLRADGARVWALAVDRAAPDAPAPDRGALARLADAGGGAEALAAEPRALVDRIAAERTLRLVQGEDAGRHVSDIGPYVALLALIPALSLFRRRL